MNQILTGVLSGVISAVAASIVVVLFTTLRLRKERGFDRRLVWCESMMSAINAAGAAVSSASTSDNPGGREDCWSQTIRLYEELIPLCGLKEIYAPRAGVKEIQAFMGELEILIKAHLDSHRTDRLATDSGPCLTQLRLAATSLARIARGHLGLESLPDSMTEPSRRFLGSFRGRDLGQHRDAFSKERDGV